MSKSIPRGFLNPLSQGRGSILGLDFCPGLDFGTLFLRPGLDFCPGLDFGTP